MTKEIRKLNRLAVKLGRRGGSNFRSLSVGEAISAVPYERLRELHYAGEVRLAEEAAPHTVFFERIEVKREAQ